MILLNGKKFIHTKSIKMKKIATFLKEKDILFKLFVSLPVITGIIWIAIYALLTAEIYGKHFSDLNPFWISVVLNWFVLFYFIMFFPIEMKRMTRNEIKKIIKWTLLAQILPIISVIVLLVIGLREVINKPLEIKES